MKKRNLFVMSGIAAMCTLGFGLNVNANTVEETPIIATQEPTTQATQDIVTPETTTDETATLTPCSYGHENCDGVHANGDCLYGYEPGTGMGYHQGNGRHDDSHDHQQLHDGSEHTNDHETIAE